MSINSRLNKKSFYYAVRYAQILHNVIPVKDLYDENRCPYIPYQLVNNVKSNVGRCRSFECPGVFKKLK